MTWNQGFSPVFVFYVLTACQKLQECEFNKKINCLLPDIRSKHNINPEISLHTLIVVPHAVIGNWKITKAEVASTGVQERSLLSRRLTDCTSMGGKVASRATTTTNWPSLVHCTVTEGEEK